MKYIEFLKGKQNAFLRHIKEKSKISWEKLAKKLGISRSMVYFYLNESSKMPYSNYIEFCRIAGINQNKFNKKIIEIKNREEKIGIPNMSKILAEFIGAIAGDGHLSNANHEISIAMDKRLDKEYAEHILKLYNLLFGIKPRKYLSKGNGMKCFAYSKKLCSFLSDKYGLPIGKKKNRLNIPAGIKNDNNLLRAYIRGVFDTDGSFNRHHKKNAMISISSRDPTFILEIKEALNKLGFTASLSHKNIQIYRKEEIDRFFKEIKPSNYKHLFKYAHYKKHNEVPLTKELLKR